MKAIIKELERIKEGLEDDRDDSQKDYEIFKNNGQGEDRGKMQNKIASLQEAINGVSLAINNLFFIY